MEHIKVSFYSFTEFQHVSCNLRQCKFKGFNVTLVGLVGAGRQEALRWNVWGCLVSQTFSAELY